MEEFFSKTVESDFGESNVLWINAKKYSSKRKFFVFVPGNPGIGSFYKSFLNLVHKSFPDFHAVLFSHIGHSKDDQHKIYTHSLRDQIDHKVSIMKDSLGITDDDTVILCGHSIGAHICMEMMKEIKVKHSAFLFPAIRYIGDSPKGQKMKAWFTTPGRLFMSTAGYVLSWLPTSWRQSLIHRHLGTQDVAPHLMDSVDQMFSFGSMNNILYMSRTEMDTVKEVDEEHIKSNADKMSFFFGDGDWWVPNKHHDFIKHLTKDSDTRVDMLPEFMKHDFCMNEEQTVEMAKRVVEVMEGIDL
eukprot:TRINITY_DN778134_c0_g1_i1.p1 TRINITY_DN778134_c0_g1~~TRINITY_DN778134_c0_g1_i1.p1  ORF type:complete len:300 (+),score=38.68 TRINITY_DN778134_c0_g1_i1:67-966(+)